ncbi:MAG: DUF1593 domain-containing protein [Bacteroidota bacterium]
MKKIVLVLALFLGFNQSFAYPKLPRTIVTTDGEIDDVDTFIRMLLYSNEYKVEGLIYSSSMWHYKGDGKGTLFTSEMPMTNAMYGKKTDLRWAGVTWIQELLAAYKKVYPNLSKNANNYPSPEYLMSLVKVGNIDFEGEMEKITDGSEWIKAKLLDADSDPIYLQAWGGTNTIARALKSIEDEYSKRSDWEKIKDKVSNKAIIYTILDQDATYKKYIGIHWPKILTFYNSTQFAAFAYPWKKMIPLSMQSYFEGPYMSSKIILNHGALLAMYYSYGDGKKQAGDPEHIHGDLSKIKNSQWGNFNQYDFISEGDSPAFLQLVDVGLNNLDHPNYGGWGGRFVKSPDNAFRYEDGPHSAEFNPESNTVDNNYPQTRWLKAIQEDFAARADWCVKPFAAANHAPIVSVKEGADLYAKAGQKLVLHIDATDPDKNIVQLKAWSYPEAGSGKANIVLKGKSATVEIPANAKKGETYHFVMEGNDNGSPSLTRYKRVIVTVI